MSRFIDAPQTGRGRGSVVKGHHRRGDTASIVGGATRTKGHRRRKANSIVGGATCTRRECAAAGNSERVILQHVQYFLVFSCKIQPRDRTSSTKCFKEKKKEKKQLQQLCTLTKKGKRTSTIATGPETGPSDRSYTAAR